MSRSSHLRLHGPSGPPISDAHARLLAYFWEERERPDFSVTVLARTGAIRPDTEVQLTRDLGALDAAADQSSDDGVTISQFQVSSLLEYVRRYGPRDAVDGWRNLRDDGEFRSVTASFARRRRASLTKPPRSQPRRQAEFDGDTPSVRFSTGPELDHAGSRSSESRAGELSMYEIVGGEDAVRLVVDSFYEKVLGDERLVHHFENTNVGRLKAHQRAFITAVMGGPQDEYADLEQAADRLAAAHNRLRITHGDFNIVVGHLVATLTEVGVSADIIEQLAPRVLQLRDLIVTVAEVHPFDNQPDRPTAMTHDGASTQTIYDAVGDDGVRAAVDLFYEKVLGDDRVNGYFEGITMARLKAHQRAFITAVVGGPNTYTGRSMHDAHSHLGITHDAFDTVVGHLVATLTELGVPAHQIDDVAPSVLALRDDIVTA